MFSQPTNSLKDDEIIKTREKTILYLENQEYELVNIFLQMNDIARIK